MDIALFYQSESMRIDAALMGGLLLTDETLLTAAIISLFTDKLAGPDDVLPSADNWRRGWWGDALDEDGDEIGSHLWLLARAKQTEETRRRAEEYTLAALAWMKEDGVASAVDVQARWKAPATGILLMSVAISRPEGSAERYYFSFDTQKAEAFYHAV